MYKHKQNTPTGTKSIWHANKETKLNSQAPYSAILLTCILSEAPDTVEQQDNAHNHEITTLHVETQTLGYDHN